MLDLRVLRDRWTEDGAREVFAQLVTLCVKSLYPEARAVRPDPGDDGIDTFAGTFDGELRVWQAKYFCDEVGRVQQGQIRESWSRCTSSRTGRRLTAWTLCIPIELSTEEERWWQGWKKREAFKHKCAIYLWPKSEFTKFSMQPDLVSPFALALARSTSVSDTASLLHLLRGSAQNATLKALPNSEHLQKAVFVRKLEAAGVRQHRAARTAFYNFELLREAVTQGGTPSDRAALQDLQERVLELWETSYNETVPERLGREFWATVNNAIRAENDGRLSSALPAKAIHKTGALYHWADICEAGWTRDFKNLIREEEEP